MNVITIRPKNISKKKLFLILRFINLPYPEIDNETKIILTKKKKISKKTYIFIFESF